MITLCLLLPYSKLNQSHPHNMIGCFQLKPCPLFKWCFDLAAAHAIFQKCRQNLPNGLIISQNVELSRGAEMANSKAPWGTCYSACLAEMACWLGQEPWSVECNDTWHGGTPGRDLSMRESRERPDEEGDADVTDTDQLPPTQWQDPDLV